MYTHSVDPICSQPRRPRGLHPPRLRLGGAARRTPRRQSICLSVNLSVCLPVCLSIYGSTHYHVHIRTSIDMTLFFSSGPHTEIKKTMSIQLGGLMHLPPLVGAHWGNAGLTVVALFIATLILLIYFSLWCC